MNSEFRGFPAEGLDYLTRLGSADKAWFAANRATYEEFVVAPTKAFVRDLGARLVAGFAPAIVAEPKANGSIAPINNDLRFSPDKHPYKDHLLLKFWEGPDKKTAPTLHVRVSADEVGFATGAMLGDLDRWRILIDAEGTGAPLAQALGKLAQRRHLAIAGEGYKRVPKPYASDHPRGALLRHKWFQARWSEPLPKSINSAKFVDFCTKRLEACSDVHRWLVGNL